LIKAFHILNLLTTDFGKTGFCDCVNSFPHVSLEEAVRDVNE